MAIKIAILISIVFLVRLIRSGNNIMSLELEPKEAMGYLISNKDLNLTCRCVNCTENTFLSVLATRKNEEHKFAINYDRNLLYVENVNFTDARVVVINSSYDVNKKTKTIKATFRIISTQVVSMDLTCNAAAFAQTNVTVGEYSAGLPPPITGPYFDVIRQIVSIRCEANGETYPPFREFAWRAISFDFENLDLSQLKVQNTHNSSTIFIPSQDPYFGGNYFCKARAKNAFNISEWSKEGRQHYRVNFAKFKDVTREVFPIDGMSTFRCTLHSYPNITKSIDWVDKWDSPVQNRSNFKPFILSSISIDKYLYSTTFALRVVNATSRDYGRYFCRLTDFTQFKIIAASDYIRFNYTFIPDPPSNVLINKTASRITWTQSYFPNNEGYYKLAFRNPNGKVLDFKMTSAKIYKKGAYFNIDGNQSFVSIRSCNEFGCSRLVYEEQKPDEGSDPAVQIDNPTRGDNLLSWIMCIIGIGFMIIFIFVAFLLICNKRICCKGKHSNVKDGKTYYAAASEQPFRDFPTYKDQMRYNGRPESFFQAQRIPLAHIDDDDSSSYRGERRISSS